MHAGWSYIRLSDGPNTKLVVLVGWAGPSLVSCLAIRGSAGVFFCCDISVLSLTPQGSSGLTIRCFVSVQSISLNHQLISDLIPVLRKPS